ncbi:MAG: hypothetical protein HDS08_06980 [Bacteroides sp.]|nr:hypothetical protein [Bacteroides sp.]
MAKLSDRQQLFFSRFQTNEGAYFFKIRERIINNDIIALFNEIERSATEFSSLTKFIRAEVILDSGKTARSSLLVFRNSFVPDFMREISKIFPVKEQLICYMLVIEIDDYIVLFSRHANGQSEFKKKLSHIPAKELAGALLSMNSVFTQMRLASMNMNPDALRNKSYEGDNLSVAMPMFDSGHNIVKAARIQTESGMVTISLSTSRLSKIGSARKFINELCEWSDRVIDGIKNPYDISTTLLGQFSAPIRWEEYDSLGITPAFLKVDSHELIQLMVQENKKIMYRNSVKDEPKEVSERFFNKIIERCSNIFTLSSAGEENIYKCDGTSLLTIKEAKRGLALSGKKILEKLYVANDNESTRLVSYLNQKRCFFVGFSDVAYIYFNGALHKDGDIGATMQTVLSIFEDIADMNGATTEKGDPTATSTAFEKTSIFHVVEKHYSEKGATHIICDDLGDEWADHIVLMPDKISFVHSKSHPQSGLSASNFQIVIAQAIKNIGNIRRLDIDGKVNGWTKKKYSTTNIDHCRKGNINTFAKEYKKAQISPNTVREVCIAVNFISLSNLKNACNEIIEKGHHSKIGSVIQLIWMLSAFISSCRDAGLQARILCRE